MSERSEQLFALIEGDPARDVRVRYTDIRVPGGRVGHAVEWDLSQNDWSGRVLRHRARNFFHSMDSRQSLRNVVERLSNIISC